MTATWGFTATLVPLFKRQKEEGKQEGGREVRRRKGSQKEEGKTEGSWEGRRKLGRQKGSQKEGMLIPFMNNLMEKIAYLPSKSAFISVNQRLLSRPLLFEVVSKGSWEGILIPLMNDQ